MYVVVLSRDLPTKFPQLPNLRTFITLSLFNVLAVLALHSSSTSFWCQFLCFRLANFFGEVGLHLRALKNRRDDQLNLTNGTETKIRKKQKPSSLEETIRAIVHEGSLEGRRETKRYRELILETR